MDVISQVMGICFDFYNRTWFFDGYEFSLVEVWCFEMMGTLVAIFVVRFLMFWITDITRGVHMSDEESEEIETDNDFYTDYSYDWMEENIDVNPNWNMYDGSFDSYVDSFDVPDDWLDDL